MVERMLSAETKRRRKRRARREEPQRWRLSLLRSFISKHGADALTMDTRVAPGVAIGSWATVMRTRYRQGTLAAWLCEGLEAIPGWTWTPLADRKRGYAARLAAYVRDGGLTLEELLALGRWIRLRRTDFARGKLRRGLRQALETISGWSWEQRAPR